jgi:hypothetical protein
VIGIGGDAANGGTFTGSYEIASDCTGRVTLSPDGGETRITLSILLTAPAPPEFGQVIINPARAVMHLVTGGDQVSALGTGR